MSRKISSAFLTYRTLPLSAMVLSLVSALLFAACARSDFGSTSESSELCVDVPEGECNLYDDHDKLLPWNSPSYERAAASEIRYKGRVFRPQIESDEMQKKIAKLHINDVMEKLKAYHFDYTLLRDGRVLGRDGGYHFNFQYVPATKFAIIDPKTKSVEFLPGLKEPRADCGIVQLADDRIIFIGGETTSRFAKGGSDNLTDSVEELDVDTGETRILGRILEPRHGVFAEVLNDRDILVVGGWNQRHFAGDERWWPGAEILRVPSIESPLVP